MASLKIVTMDAATPYERGVQYGTQAKAEIDIAIEFYRKKFEKKFDWNTVIGYSKCFTKATGEFAPEILEEMQGIADGSGRTLDEIMIVNARYEISQFDYRNECSTGVYINLDEGKKFIFKNCDLGDAVKAHLVLLRVKKPDGFQAFGVAEAGQLVRDGYNNCGVALVNSALMCQDDHAGEAVPGTVLRKKIWESTSFEAACSVQRGCFRTTSTNTLIAHRDGKALDFECYPGGEDEIPVRDNIIATGNRFTVHSDFNRFEDGLDLIDRGIRLRSLLEANRKEISAKTLMKIMSDHEGHPCAICRHRGGGIDTCYSIIVDMVQEVIYFCLGNPCENPYEVYYF